MVVRQADPDEAVDGVEAQHGSAGGAAELALAALGFGFSSSPYDVILMRFVTIFTLISVSLYLVEWVQHMSTIEAA